MSRFFGMLRAKNY